MTPRADQPEPPDDPFKRLDEMFVGEARYHEPSAAERAAAARDAKRQAERDERARAKEIARTRRILSGDADSGGFDKRTAMLGWIAIAAIAVVLAFTPFAS